MSFGAQLQHTVTVSRFGAGAGIQQTWSQVALEVPAFIQPVTAEYAMKVGHVFGRTYNAWFDTGANVQMGDKLVDQDGKEYRVAGMMNNNYGRNPHIQALITEEVRQTPDQ